MKQIILFLFVLCLLAGCGEPSADGVVATQVAIAKAVAATLTAEAPLPAATPANTPRPPAPALRQPEERAIDGMLMVYVQAGEFTLGDDEGDADARPAHTVTLDAFWIDRTEVTNAQYRRCVEAGACTLPCDTTSDTRHRYYGDSAFDDYPVIYVTWTAAQAYCAWAGARLPTEAEWEKAARGPDGRPFPWGDHGLDCSLANYDGMGSCVRDTCQVGSYPAGASPYGALDMAGNVMEWVADWYDAGYYAGSPAANPPGPDSGKRRVVRGGSWISSGSYVRATARMYYDPYYCLPFVGFRCAADSPGE